MSWIDVILGRRLASKEQGERTVGVVTGFPAFGLDGLSSSAYGPEAALTMLLPLGAAGLGYIGPIMLAIVGLLTILYFSYRQTIAAYPVNGGSYTVASENLGAGAGLLAAAALMIDYVLTVAVGISAGVAALVSAVPQAHPFTLPICLVILGLITVINLRGTKEAGWAFAFPTYFFLASLGGVIAVGMWRAVASGGHPTPIDQPPPIAAATEATSLWLLMRAFASGCTAMTGVEAVSNGVSAFREPRVQTARRTLTLIVVSLAILLGGIAYLAHAYELGAMDQDKPGYQSVLSQLIAAVAGRGVIYYATLASILCVLCLSANTSFVDFPRLCRLVAQDDFLPRTFADLSRRLVFSMGIFCLASAAAALLILFRGVTDRLIPLYAVGAFTAFTLSQAGMVAHWRREARKCRGSHASKDSAKAGAKSSANTPAEGAANIAAKSDVKKNGDHSKEHAAAQKPAGGAEFMIASRMAVNATGAVATAIALGIILVAKFVEGAWVTIVAIPALIGLFCFVKAHYRELGRQVGVGGELKFDSQPPPVVIVAVGGWDKPAAKSVRLAMRISPDVIAVHLTNLSGDEEHDPLRRQWTHDVEIPAHEAGLTAPRLMVVQTPYRTFVEPILKTVQRIEKQFPDRPIAVMIPTLIQPRWWQWVLRSGHTHRLRKALEQSNDRRTIVISVPWHLDEK